MRLGPTRPTDEFNSLNICAKCELSPQHREAKVTETAQKPKSDY